MRNSRNKVYWWAISCQRQFTGDSQVLFICLLFYCTFISNLKIYETVTLMLKLDSKICSALFIFIFDWQLIPLPFIVVRSWCHGMLWMGHKDSLVLTPIPSRFCTLLRLMETFFSFPFSVNYENRKFTWGLRIYTNANTFVFWVNK